MNEVIYHCLQHLWKNHSSLGTCKCCSSALCCKSANEADGTAACRVWLCSNCKQEAGSTSCHTLILRTWGKLLVVSYYLLTSVLNLFSYNLIPFNKHSCLEAMFSLEWWFLHRLYNNFSSLFHHLNLILNCMSFSTEYIFSAFW